MHILLWVFKSRVNQSGESAIRLRITLNGKRTEVSTNIAVDLQSWDKNKQRIKGNSPLVKEYNQALLNLTTAVWNHYNDAVRRNMPVSGDMIRDLLLGKNKPVHTLLEVFKYQIENLEKRIGFDISVNTIKKYKTVETKLKSFLPKILNRSDINLGELTHKFITDLEMYMKVTEGLKHNAVIKNMQQLKRVIKVCILNGWLEKDPFLNFKLNLNDTERGYLSPQELKLIEEIHLSSERLSTVRDMFIFCCYTGLAYADVSKLTKQHLEMDDNGVLWIKLNRTKTKSRSVIPVLPKAREIMTKYEQYAKGNPYHLLLPVISNQNLNKYLKEVADACGITKRVSMHLARHTFATTVTLSKGIDIMTVSKMLGHKNLRTTQIYSKVTELKVAEDMKKLL